MTDVKKKLNEIVRQCNSDAVTLKKYTTDNWESLDDDMRFELYMRIANLQGHF